MEEEMKTYTARSEVYALTESEETNEAILDAIILSDSIVRKIHGERATAINVFESTTFNINGNDILVQKTFTYNVIFS